MKFRRRRRCYGPSLARVARGRKNAIKERAAACARAYFRNMSHCIPSHFASQSHPRRPPRRYIKCDAVCTSHGRGRRPRLPKGRIELTWALGGLKQPMRSTAFVPFERGPLHLANRDGDDGTPSLTALNAVSSLPAEQR